MQGLPALSPPASEIACFHPHYLLAPYPESREKVSWQREQGSRWLSGTHSWEIHTLTNVLLFSSCDNIPARIKEQKVYCDLEL